MAELTKGPAGEALTLGRLVELMRARFPAHPRTVLVDAANDLLYATSGVPSYFRVDHWVQLVNQMSHEFIDRFRKGGGEGAKEEPAGGLAGKVTTELAKGDSNEN